MSNATHPDFNIPALTACQLDWLTANGIEAQPATDSFAGFYFSKGDRYILPVRAYSTDVYLMERDDHEDGDGEIEAGRFPRLRDALRALAA